MVTVVPSSNLPPRTHKAGWRLPRVIKCVLGGNRVKVTFVKCINREARRLIYSLTQHKQVFLLKEKFTAPQRSSVF